jgi:WD40 repeat protein
MDMSTQCIYSYAMQGHNYFTGLCNGLIHRFSTDDGEYQGQSYKGHSGIVLTLVAPEEPFGDAGLLSGSKDGTLRGWDVQSAKQVFRLRNPSPVETVALANRKAYAGTSR